MKEYSMNVSLICPLCGNDLFSCVNGETKDLLNAPGSTKLRCVDCGSIYSKDEIIDFNSEKIEITRDEMIHDFLQNSDTMKKLERTIRKAFK